MIYSKEVANTVQKKSKSEQDNYIRVKCSQHPSFSSLGGAQSITPEKFIDLDSKLRAEHLQKLSQEYDSVVNTIKDINKKKKELEQGIVNNNSSAPANVSSELGFYESHLCGWQGLWGTCMKGFGIDNMLDEVRLKALIHDKLCGKDVSERINFLKGLDLWPVAIEEKLNKPSSSAALKSKPKK